MDVCLGLKYFGLFSFFGCSGSNNGTQYNSSSSGWCCMYVCAWNLHIISGWSLGVTHAVQGYIHTHTHTYMQPRHPKSTHTTVKSSHHQWMESWRHTCSARIRTAKAVWTSASHYLEMLATLCREVYAKTDMELCHCFLARCLKITQVHFLYVLSVCVALRTYLDAIVCICIHVYLESKEMTWNYVAVS